MSTKRKRAPAKKPASKRGKRKDSDIDSDLSDNSEAENSTQPDEVLIAGHGDVLDEQTQLPQELLKTLIKPAGQLLIFGMVNWDQVGRRDQGTKGATKPNIYVPNRFTDIKVSFCIS